jgi:biotin transport system permease protein/energy-coupling factor transport system permease protein
VKGLTGYVDGKGGIFSLDARTKIIGAAALSVVGLRSGVPLLLFVSLLSLAITGFARISPRRLYQAFRPALPFIAIVFLLHALFVTGAHPSLFGLGNVRTTAEGILEGGLLAWRFALLLLAGFLLTMTTRPASLTSGMERLLRPMKLVGVSSQDLALMVSLALRFIPVLQEEMETLADAQKARGASFASGGVAGRIRAFSSLALPLSLAVFRRCDQLVEAMHARAYDGGPRTDLRELAFTRGDWVVIIVSVLAAAGSFLV